MPTYDYRCTVCGHQFEKVQKFTDEPIKVCPVCGQTVRKVFHPAGVVFKGSGWYINDSRKPDKTSEKKTDTDTAKDKDKDKDKVETPTAEAPKTETKAEASNDTAKTETKPEKSEAKTETKKSDTAA